MSNAQFEALEMVVAGNPAPAEKRKKGEPADVKVMAVKRKLDHVRNCILKLKPSTLEEMLRSVRTITPFTGGFAEKEIEHLLKILIREGLFKIAENGTISYERSSISAANSRFVEISGKPDSKSQLEKTPLMAE